MTSAPSVNQMRFLSSSALENEFQLMLAASCSAADAIWCSAVSKARQKRSGPPKPAGLNHIGSGLGRCDLAQYFYRTTRLLNRCDSALGSCRHFERKLGL